jgi:flavin-dependent dehydrogenase
VIKIKIEIIGGSLGGISAGISLKKNDKSIDVIIHEKHNKIGYNFEGRRCGEAHSIVSEWISDIPGKESIYNHISRAEVEIGDKKRIINEDKDKCFILNRQEYIHQLGKRAKKLGVKILTNDKIKSINDLNGDYVIDASGCPSIIKKELGLKRGIKGSTYQQTLENSNSFISNTVKLFYSDFGGYFWIFPRNPLKKEINLGVGSFRKYNYNLKEMLEEFKEEQKIEGEINHITGGLIPIGLQRPLRYKNILFVGDAGVGAYPISGQGIYRAIISGDIAGRVLAMNKPKKYSHMMYKIFLRWDLICKSLFFPNFIFRKINPKLILSSLNQYLNLLEVTHI